MSVEKRKGGTFVQKRKIQFHFRRRELYTVKNRCDSNPGCQVGLMYSVQIPANKFGKLYPIHWSTTKGRFHQHFTRSIYAQRSQKHKKILMT